MSCDGCPEGISVHPEIDPDDPEFKDFYTNEFVQLLTPYCATIALNVEVAVPLSVGQHILDYSRMDPAAAKTDAEEYISDLATVQNFILDELDAIKRVLELDGYDVKFTVGVQDDAPPAIDAGE